MTAGNWTGWTDSIMNLLKAKEIKIGDEFSLEQMYNCEPILREIYPKNNQIRAKIRQQLQILRDYQIIEFLDNQGRYLRIR
jgi:type II restriction enzyme